MPTLSQPQFGLKQLFVAITLIAVMLTWVKLFWVAFRDPTYFLPGSVFQYACLLATLFCLTQAVLYACTPGGSPHAACMLTLGWLLALLDCTQGIIDSFSGFGDPSPAEYILRMQQEIGRALALPLLATFLVVLFGKMPYDRLRRVRYGLIAVVLVALADLAIYGLFAPSIHEAMPWPRGRIWHPPNRPAAISPPTPAPRAAGSGTSPACRRSCRR